MQLQKQPLLLLCIGIICMLSVFAPAPVLAQSGIVPCGDLINGQKPCDLCHLYTLTKNGVDFMLFDFILPVAVIALLIGGMYMLASAGNPQMLQTGKTAITNTIIGVLIAFGAWLVIATIVNTLGYTGFTAAWNEAPTCLPSPINQPPSDKPPTAEKICVRKPRPGVRESCTDMGSREACITGCAGGTCQASCPAFKKFCVKSSPASCIDKGSEEACTRLCTAAGSTCETSCPGTTGTCSTVPTGPCAENNLSSSCFGSGLGNQASQICLGESGGNRLKKGDPITGNGITVFRSIGLFQINLSAHSIGGLNCPSAFEGENKPLKNTPKARILYDKCVTVAQDANTNITKACEIRSARGNWKDWWCTAHSCGLYPTPCPR